METQNNGFFISRLFNNLSKMGAETFVISKGSTDIESKLPKNIFLAKNNKTSSLDSHGYMNPLEIVPLSAAGLDVDASKSANPPTTTVASVPTTTSNPTMIPRDSKDQKPQDRDSSDPKSPTEKKTLARTLTQPAETIEYQVMVSDTLTRIAARFETTPSELCKLNRLSSRLIFPGQMLFVPDKRTKKPVKSPSNAELDQSSGSQEAPQVRVAAPSGQNAGSPVDHVDRPVSSSADNQATPSASPDPDNRVKFLKINAKHITDGQGVVSGVLIITPNAVIFDPNVSDILVIEHGCESYGVVAPVDLVIKAAMYSDIAHMRVKHAPERMPNVPKPEIYFGKDSQTFSDAIACEEEKCQMTDKTTAEDNSKECEVKNGHVQSSLMRTSIEEKGETEDDPSQETSEQTDSSFRADGPAEQTLKSSSIDSEGMPFKEDVEDNVFSEEGQKFAKEAQELTEEGRGLSLDESILGSSSGEEGVNYRSLQRTESRKEKMLKRLSYPVGSITSFTQSSISKVLATPKHLVDLSGKVFVKGEDGGKNKEGGATSDTIPAPPKDKSKSTTPADEKKPVVGYKNMVEEKHDIFAAFDKLIPRPAKIYEDQPLYLCLRMGRPANKKELWNAPIISYGKKKLKSEYWFSIPQIRVEDLYQYFIVWFPHKYGDVDVNPEELGYVEIDSDEEEDEEEEEELMKEELVVLEEGQGSEEQKEKRGFLKFSWLKSKVEAPFWDDGLTPTDWDVVTGPSPVPELADLPLPELLDISEIFTDEYRKELIKHFPGRAEGYPWALIYSSLKHGFSLKTLYREMAKYETPVILVVADTNGYIFGAFISCSLKMSEYFYGTGESFLFTLNPEFKCYHWTGENTYFVKGNTESLAIGAGEGQFGLWLDGDLYHGRSNKSLTFGNDMLSSDEDFVVKTLELWGFI